MCSGIDEGSTPVCPPPPLASVPPPPSPGSPILSGDPFVVVSVTQVSSTEVLIAISNSAPVGIFQFTVGTIVAAGDGGFEPLSLGDVNVQPGPAISASEPAFQLDATSSTGVVFGFAVTMGGEIPAGSDQTIITIDFSGSLLSSDNICLEVRSVINYLWKK